jgi:drug/metabolite transporter (DMT)-like permease
MVVVTFLFLVLRGIIRAIRRQRPKLSDLFVTLSWLGYFASSVLFTILNNLQTEFSSSNTSTVSVSAAPDKLIQVFKVQSRMSVN